MVRIYNEQQPVGGARLMGALVIMMLQTAVSSEEMLHAVKSRDNDRRVMGGEPMTFEQYLLALKAA